MSACREQVIPRVLASLNQYSIGSNAEFLCHAFRGINDDEVPWVTGFPGDPQSIQHRLWGGRSAFPLPWFIRNDFNNYVAVSSFKRGEDGKFHRRKDNFGHLHLVMIDDIGTKVSFHKLKLSPTLIVETSPDNYQGWYFLRTPEADRLKAEALINGMINAGLTADATDPGMKGVTRYGRLPIGINSKAKYVEQLGRPFVQRVGFYYPTECRYTLDEIAAAYGVDLTTQAKRSTTGGRRSRKSPVPGIADGYLDLLSSADLYVEPVGSMDSAHQIICPWLHEHTDEDPSGTVYFEPSDQNDWHGGFKCHHGHCQARTIADLTHFLIRLQELNTRTKS